jgi:amino acid adenylation domain-containing protein
MTETGVGTDPFDDRCVHDLVAAAVAAHPDHPAVAAADETITYRELWARSGRLAGGLADAGVVRPSVGLLLPRSADFVVAALAVLRAGGHYVPLDPDYPRERLRAMLAGAACSVVFGTTALLHRLPDDYAGATISVDTVDTVADRPAGSPGASAHPDDLAYVMFTSGSTGTPKGVMITHRGVVRLVRPPGIVEVSADDVVLHVSSVSFDAATFDIWSALTTGATLVVAPPGRPSGVDVAALVRRHRVTTALLPTGLFHLMVDEQPSDLAGLRKLVVGGDALSAAHAGRFIAAAPNSVLVNAYGPTEVTVATTVHTVSRDEDPVPIGRAMPGTAVRLLDDDLRPVRPGAVGEIYAGGRGLARGYAGDPAQTAARFVPDPDVPGARLYATGDRARRRPDGALEFLGRTDDQVKKRGYRVEPSEVESALRADPAVRDAFVFADGASAETRRLVVVLTPTAGPADAVFLDAARTGLRARVPEYLVPDLWTVVDTVPLTLGGKVDRAALRQLAVTARTAAGPAPAEPEAVPTSAAEAALAAIWRDVLDVERIDADADFFELGGHSLLANKIVYQVRKRLGVILPLHEIFDRPQFDDLVAAVRGLGLPSPSDDR